MSEDGIDIPLLGNDLERSLGYFERDIFEPTKSETERKDHLPPHDACCRILNDRAVNACPRENINAASALAPNLGT